VWSPELVPAGWFFFTDSGPANLPFSEWGTVFPDPRLVAAIVDRVTYNARIIETGTQSYRLDTGKTTTARKPMARPAPTWHHDRSWTPIPRRSSGTEQQRPAEVPRLGRETLPSQQRCAFTT